MPAGSSRANCHRLAPATQKRMKAVRVSTPVVPRSGSLMTRKMIGATSSRNGIVPSRMLLMRWPRLAIQWAR